MMNTPSKLARTALLALLLGAGGALAQEAGTTGTATGTTGTVTGTETAATAEDRDDDRGFPWGLLGLLGLAGLMPKRDKVLVERGTAPR